MSSILIVLALGLGTVRTLRILAAALQRSGAISNKSRSGSSSDAVLRAVVPDIDIRGLAAEEKSAE
jgi:hypothetical protein